MDTMLVTIAISCKPDRTIFNPFLIDRVYLTLYRGRVFALDMFETGFKEDSMSKEAGRRYRDLILRIGGSKPS